MDKWEAQYQFWSGFGVPAYEENSVPDRDHVIFPYITYQSSSSGFDEDTFPSASIWTRSSSWAAADALSDAIENALKNGGVVIRHNTGAIWITPRTPFSSSMGDPEDDMIKRKSISVTLHFI